MAHHNVCSGKTYVNISRGETLVHHWYANITLCILSVFFTWFLYEKCNIVSIIISWIKSCVWLCFALTLAGETFLLHCGLLQYILAVVTAVMHSSQDKANKPQYLYISGITPWQQGSDMFICLSGALVNCLVTGVLSAGPDMSVCAAPLCNHPVGFILWRDQGERPWKAEVLTETVYQHQWYLNKKEWLPISCVGYQDLKSIL